jgi:hypothetical protein
VRRLQEGFGGVLASTNGSASPTSGDVPDVGRRKKGETIMKNFKKLVRIKATVRAGGFSCL